MFFLKNKPIVLECFTDNSSAFEYAKPDYSFRFIPDWWKQIPKADQKIFAPEPNMKKCAGFIDYFKTGFGIPLWSDLDVEIGPVGTEFYRWKYSDGKSFLDSHPFTQTGGFLDIKENVHIKLINPWVYSCRENINWLWNSFGWHDLKRPNVSTLPGIISFKYQNGANINLLFTRTEKEQLFHFRFNTPLVHVAPINDRKFKLIHHLVSQGEMLKILNKNNPITFVNKYQISKKLLRKTK